MGDPETSAYSPAFLRYGTSYWQGPLQNYSLPTYIRDAGYTTGIFGKELNANTETFVSPGWDRFFALGGNDEVRIERNIVFPLMARRVAPTFLPISAPFASFSLLCSQYRATTMPTGFAKTGPASTSALTPT